jgi:DnaJ family protein A protein 2
MEFTKNIGKGIKIKEEDKCTQCKGERIVKKTKILEVDIDKGAPDKKRYVFEGESDEVPGALPGDVYVEINILKNAKFIRNGADLIVNYNISLYEALTGFSIIFEHLDKRKVLIKSRECEKISHGMIKTIKDLGMPFFESSHKFGNLYIRITVDFPNKLEPSDKEALYSILIDQKKEDKFDEVNEKYFLTDFIESEENTNHSGGKKEERRTGEN